jgi:hypothetical protein
MWIIAGDRYGWVNTRSVALPTTAESTTLASATTPAIGIEIL